MEPFANTKVSAPKIRNQVQSDKEMRVDLPFQFKLDSLIYIDVVDNETWTVNSHHHDHFELCYVAEGKGWFSIDEYLYDVQEGDLFLTKPGQIHQGAVAGEQPYRLYYFGFKLDEMRSLEADFYKVGIDCTAADEQGVVKKLCDLIFQEIRENHSHAAEMAQGYFIQLLVSILRIYEGKSTSVGQTPLTIPQHVKGVLTHLHDQVQYYPNLDELATNMHISRSHLDREFKQFMGVSLGHYMRGLCIDRAKYWLRESTESITTISEKLQFESIHTFSIFFKRLTGVSPRIYRQQVK